MRSDSLFVRFGRLWRIPRPALGKTNSNGNVTVLFKWEWGGSCNFVSKYCYDWERMDLSGLGFTGGMGVPYRARAVSVLPLSSPDVLRPGFLLDGVLLVAGDSVLLVAQADAQVCCT